MKYPLWTYPAWAWITLAAALVAVLTFGAYAPRWEMDFLVWRIRTVKPRAQRKQS